jgi:7-cyano-7-deazaguanine synthase
MAQTKALVLLSGGQDSATCLAMALAEGHSVETLTFDYGQRHRIEITQAEKLAQLAGVPFRLVEIPFFSQLTESALTDHSKPIEAAQGEIPNTFVPGRNLIFLSLGAICAYQKDISTVYTGVCQTDYSGYPDCRDEFVKSLNRTVNLALLSDIEIKTPLMFMTKAETVHKMKEMGKLRWYKETHTCYEGKRPACGKCPACKLRLAGFAEAGVSDPLEYAM